MRQLVPLTITIALSGCGHSLVPEGVLSVGDVIDNQRSLAGTRVQVVGKLTDCQPLSCGIRGPKKDDRQNYISVGRNPEFDRIAQGRSGIRVIIEGKLNPSCLPPSSSSDIIALCTDRPETLADPKVIKFLH